MEAGHAYAAEQGTTHDGFLTDTGCTLVSVFPDRRAWAADPRLFVISRITGAQKRSLYVFLPVRNYQRGKVLPTHCKPIPMLEAPPPVEHRDRPRPHSA